jgi:hypothetical protein
MRRRQIGWTAFLAGLALAGCANPTPNGLVPVSGAVLLDGVPVPEADVGFQLTDQGKGAFARTGSDGRFQLTTRHPGDGARPGFYRVKVSKVELLSERPDPTSPSGKLIQTWKRLVPARYERYDTSQLSFEVVAGQTNEIVLELASQE